MVHLALVSICYHCKLHLCSARMESLTSASTGTWLKPYWLSASLLMSVRQCERTSGKDTGCIVWAVCVSGGEKGSRSVKGGVLVICHRIRYPDKAIREKQIPQPRGFNSLLLHPDELLKNGVRLKLVLYERLQICLLSGLLPPVFIGCKGLLMNRSLLLSGQRGLCLRNSSRQTV